MDKVKAKVLDMDQVTTEGKSDTRATREGGVRNQGQGPRTVTVLLRIQDVQMKLPDGRTRFAGVDLTAGWVGFLSWKKGYVPIVQ